MNGQTLFFLLLHTGQTILLILVRVSKLRKGFEVLVHLRRLAVLLLSIKKKKTIVMFLPYENKFRIKTVPLHKKSFLANFF